MMFLDKKTIKLDKTLNDLDDFVVRFIKVLKKHTDYVIVSGYVAILLGRSRTTEDIDVIIPKMSKTEFEALYQSIISSGYWCLNSSDTAELYDLLKSKHSIRFSVEAHIFPNVEIKFASNIYDRIALKQFILIKTNNSSLKTSILELQIAYKEEVLKSNKDMEDAKHLRLIAEGNLDEALINQFKQCLRGK